MGPPGRGFEFAVAKGLGRGLGALRFLENSRGTPGRGRDLDSYDPGEMVVDDDSEDDRRPLSTLSGNPLNAAGAAEDEPVDLAWRGSGREGQPAEDAGDAEEDELVYVEDQTLAPPRRSGRKRRPIQGANVRPTEGADDTDSGTSDYGAEPTRGRKKLKKTTASKPKAPRLKKGELNPKTTLRPVDEHTLMPYSLPTNVVPTDPDRTNTGRTDSGGTNLELFMETTLAERSHSVPHIKRERDSTSPRPRIKPERLSPELDLSAILPPPALLSPEPDLSVVPPPPAPPPSTQWNEDAQNSENSHRKPYCYELVQQWPPYQPPDHVPPMCGTLYTRAFLSHYIGGSSQNTRVNVGIGKQNEHNHRIALYFCSKSDWNHFLPRKPCEHGALYWCEGGKATSDPINTPYTMFCRRNPNQWEYVGEYITAHRALEEGEWESLPKLMRDTWVSGWCIIKSMKQDLVDMGLVEKEEEFNVEKVLGFIRDKKLVHSSQTYQCVGYNAKLRDWLDERWEKWPENLKKVKQEEPKEDLGEGGDLWAVPSAEEEELMSEEIDEDEDEDEEEVKGEQE